MNGQRGIALVIVLWGVTLLALLAAGFAQATGLSARRMLHAVEAAQARARLDEAVAIAVIALRQPERPWRGDGSLHSVNLPGAHAEIRVFSENGRIDLNHAEPVLLQSLFRQAAGNEETGDRLTAALAARNDVRPMLAVAELANLPGIDIPLYRRLAPAVTVHNPSGRLDWRNAGKAALSAIPGLNATQVATLMAMRGQSQYTPEPAMAELLIRAGATDNAGSGGGASMVSLQITLILTGGASASAETVLQLQPAGAAAFRIVEWRSPAQIEEGR